MRFPFCKKLILIGVLLNVGARMVWNIVFLILSGGKGSIGFSDDSQIENVFNATVYVTDTVYYLGFVLATIGIFRLLKVHSTSPANTE